MLITTDFLEKRSAPSLLVRVFKTEFDNSANFDEVMRYLMYGQNMSYMRYANWLIVRCMNRAQNIRYALFAAKLACPVYRAIAAAESAILDESVTARKFADTEANSVYGIDNIKSANSAGVYAAYTASCYAPYLTAEIAVEAAIETFNDVNKKIEAFVDILTYGMTLMDED